MRLYLVSFFFIVFNSSSGQTAEEILDHYLKTSSPHGDISKWNEIKTLYSTGEGYFNPQSVNNPRDTTFDRKDISYHKSYGRWPDEQKEELFDDSLFKHHNSSFYFLKNRTVIFLGLMDPIENTAKRSATSAMYNLYPLQIRKHMSNSKSITYNGIKTIPGPKSCYEVEIKTKDEDHFFLFNTKSYLLEAIYFPKANYYSFLSDYKLFDGYLLPTYSAGVRNGVTFSWKRYKTLEFNVKFDEHEFDPKHEGKNRPKSLCPIEVLNEDETTLSDFVREKFKGKRVFVDMWATWCSPCKWEFQHYDSAYYSFMEKENISLLYLSIDDDKKKWEEDLTKLGLKGFHARANKELIESLKEVIFEGGSITIPRYVLMDNDGTIMSKDFARPSNPRFKEELYKALQMK